MPMNHSSNSVPGSAVPRETKPFLVGWCTALAVVELYAPGYLQGANDLDFRAFYAAGYLVRTHPSRLYDLAQQAQIQHTFAPTGIPVPFYHPSYEALLFAPFSLLHYSAAYLAFIAFNMLLLLAVFLWAWPGFSRKGSGSLLAPGLPFLLFLPVFDTLLHGQDCILSLLLYSLCWRQLEAEKDISAGCLLALTLYKFHYAIPIAILIALRRGTGFAKGFLITAACLVAACIAITGISGAVTFAHLIHGAASAIGNTAAAQKTFSVYPMASPNLAGLLFACGGRFLQSPLIFNAAWAAGSLALFIWCIRMVRRNDLGAAFSIAVLCGLLISYHLYLPDLALLLLPLAILGRRLHRFTSICIFVLPILLLPIGVNSFFLLAIPMLIMLADIHLSEGNRPSLPRPAVGTAVA